MEQRFGNVVTAAKLLSQLRFRHVGMGFFWACSLLLFRTSIFAPSDEGTILVSTTTIAFSLAFNIVTIIVLAVFEYLNQGFVNRLSPWVFACLSVASTVLFSAIGNTGSSNLNLDFLIVACVFIGVGYGYFWIAWAQVYSHLHPDITTIALPLNLVIAISIFLIVPQALSFSGLPSWVFLVPLPFLSCVLLQRCKKAPEYENEPNSTKDLPRALLSLRDILAAGVIFSFLFGFMWESSVLITSSIEQTHFMPSIVTLGLAFVFTLVTLLGRRRWDLDLLLAYGVPIVVVGFALLPLMFSSNIVVAYSAMDSGYTILEIIAWVMLVTTSYDMRVCGVILGSVVRVVLLSFRVAGIVSAYFIHTLAIQSSISPAFFSVLAIVAIWFWLLLARSDKDVEDNEKTSYIDRYADDIAHIDDDNATITIGEAVRNWASNIGTQRQRETSSANDDNILFDEMASGLAETKAQDSTSKASPSQDKPEPELKVLGSMVDDEEAPLFNEIAPVLAKYCTVVGEAYGLSRREAEMLPYLALGRSAHFIADSLYISENTVRTHIRHILEKTGASSKQDITNFVYEQGMRLCG